MRRARFYRTSYFFLINNHGNKNNSNNRSHNDCIYFDGLVLDTRLSSRKKIIMEDIADKMRRVAMAGAKAYAEAYDDWMYEVLTE